jgi:SAM-dependent methyltransferase
MKNLKYSVFISLILLESCSHIELSTNSASNRVPAAFFETCKEAIDGFFGNKNSSPSKIEGVASSGIDRSYVVNNHKQNTFTTGRGLSHYKSAFSRRGYNLLTFNKDLESILNNPNAHWLDAGGGAGFATEEATKIPNSKFKSTLVSVETNAVDLFDTQTNELRRKVIKGKFIEDIAEDEIEKSDIITDMYGPMAYSAHPDQVLRKYIDNLKTNGILYIHLGDGLDTFGLYSQVITQDGKLLNLTEWLQNIDGIKVEVIKHHSMVPDTMIVGDESSRVVKITRTKSSRDIEIPKLSRTSFVEGKPSDGFIVPRMIFVEERVFEQDLDKSQYPSMIKMKNTTLEFVKDFRTGELDHAVLDNVEKLGNLPWAHFSNVPLSLNGLNEIKNIDEQHLSFNTSRLLSRMKKYEQSKQLPNIQSYEQLKKDRSIKLISDHQLNFVTEETPDKTLQSYIDSLSDNGKIILYLGDEQLGVGKAKILKKSGGYTTLINWLKGIKGINVVVKDTKSDHLVTKKKLIYSQENPEQLVTGPSTDYVDREVVHGDVVIIEIKDRSLIQFPALKLIGKKIKNDEGIEVPVYLAE